MTPEDIRALYVETLAEILFQAWAGWRGIKGAVWADCEQGMREDFLDHAESHLERFTEKGLLPVAVDYRWVYELDGTPLGYRERQYLTEWRDAELRCTGCAATERECAEKRSRHPIAAHWTDHAERVRQHREAGCCPNCRHPFRGMIAEVAE